MIPSVQKTVKAVVSAPSVVKPAPIPIPAIVEAAVPPLTAIEWTSLLVSALWSLGVSLFGVLLLVGLWRTVQLRQASLTVHEGEWPVMLVELRQRLGLSRSVELREHAQSVVPLTWGIWRPVVLLPKLARAWDEPMRRAVLLHELAHVQRGDVACQVLGRLTCVLYWFHPLAWFALRQLRQEREQACDDAVVQSGERASDYAEQLLQVARLCCAPRGLSLGVAMAEGSSIERRILSLFDTARGHGPVRRMVALALLLIGGITLCVISSAQPVAKSVEAAIAISNQSQTGETLKENLPGGTLRGEAALERMLALKPQFSEAHNGIQFAAVYSTPQMVFQDNDRLPVELFLRNASREPARLEFYVPNRIYPPMLELKNSRNEDVALSLQATPLFDIAPYLLILQPGEVCVFNGVRLGIGPKPQAPSFETPIIGKYQLTYHLHVRGLTDVGETLWNKVLTAVPLPLEVTEKEPGKLNVLTVGIRGAGLVSPERLELLKPRFGEAKRGIQMGVAVSTLKRNFPVGESIPLDLFFRNVGEKELTFNTHLDFIAYPPRVKNEKGEAIEVSRIMHWMDIGPTTITLKPGEVWSTHTTRLGLGAGQSHMSPVAGKYKLTYSEGISDVNTTPQLRTDIPALPTTNPDTSLPKPGSPDEPASAPSAPVGQMVETPNWSEYLTTGTIEFEIAPSKTAGALEARVLATLPADDSGVAKTPTQEPAVPQKDQTPVDQNDKAQKVSDVNPHDKMIVQPDGNGVAKSTIVGDVTNTLDLDKAVWWGEVVDGLEPGFWLTETGDPRNLRVPMDSLVKYRVVVRNTMDKEIEFLVRLLPFGGKDVPYLIPSDKLDPKGRITPPQPAKEFQARGAAKELYGLNAVQAITLDAGESVLLPECGLYLGKAPDERYPQIADFVPGTHWIVQPLLVHPLTFKERGEFDRLGGRDTVTKIARDGKTRQEGVVYATGSWDQELKPAYAKYHLEVGTLDASADRNAKSALWGEVEQGMQCGIRILNPQPSYQTGDTLEAELLWRNTSEAVISTTRPRPLDFYSMIDDADGKHLEIDFGARYDLEPGEHDFQPGEVRSLGVTKVTLVAQGTPGPKDNKEPGHITLEPGKYKLSASGGVGNISPNSGKYEFTVAAPEAPQPPVAPTKRQTTQPAPNIPQTRPNVRRAPTPAEPRPVVDMKRELLQRLVQGGKISSDSLNAMITLVSSEGAYDGEFISVILAKFDDSCEPESKSSKRNLLEVLTKILEIHGSSRWQEPESGPSSTQQAFLPDTESLSRLTSEILEHLIDQGVKADRSDIDAFVMALRQAHHADGTEFLRLVLRNPEGNDSPYENPPAPQASKWTDNTGGSWGEARFHAAVGLAELGESEGVEWLIKHARPNDFGLGASLFHRQHSRYTDGFMQVSCRHSLIDLFGLKPDADFAELETWWKTNKAQLHPMPVDLRKQ